MFKVIRDKARYNLVFMFLMGLIFFPFVMNVGPVIEQTYWPVLTRSKIINVTTPINPLDDQWLKFSGEAKKLRDCNFNHIEWFSGDPEGAYARLTMEILDPQTHLTKSGDTVVHGPLKVYINESQLRNNTFAIVYHRCHPFWLSRSIFYP